MPNERGYKASFLKASIKVIKINLIIFISSLALLSLSRQIVLGHPNRNIGIVQQHFPNGASRVVKMDGETLKAFEVAFASLQAIPRLISFKKRIENYTVTISDDQDNYYVAFVPKTAPLHKRPDGSATIFIGAENELGLNIQFTVSKKGYKIVRRTLYI